MADWFSSLANQAMEFADNIADSLVAQATEAQEQIIEEQKKLELEQMAKERQMNGSNLMPWETDEESRAILSQDLMENILQLPMNDLNFTVEPANSVDVHFDLSDFTSTAMKILKLDTNLARAHSKISPKMDETVFWRNYYCRISYLRSSCGIDGPAALADSKKWREVDIIHPPHVSSVALEADTKVVAAAGDRGHAAKMAASSIVGSSSGAAKAGEDDDVDVNGISDGERDEADGDGGEIDMSDMDDLLDDMLGDADVEDFEEIGKSEYTGTTSNDELEAQIAQELAEDDD